MMDEGTSNNQADKNDQIMAALAHVTIVIPLIGIIAPIVIWATQKEKSEFIAFQSLQAVIYQLTIVLAYFVGIGCYMCSFLGMFLTIPFASEDTSAQFQPIMLGTFIPFCVMGLLLVGGLIYVLYGLIGALLVFQGKDFRYVVIGSWLERYLES